MTHARVAISIVLSVTMLSFAFEDSESADLSPVEALKACARIENTDERVACYETLGERVLDEEAVVAESPADVAPPPAAELTAAELPAVAAPVAAAATPAEIAATNPALHSDEDEKKKPIYGHVRSCQEASDRNWFFILDNGDIWKQSGGKKRRFKDCDFDVVIRKDIFGNKMTIAGDDQTVRVRRQK